MPLQENHWAISFLSYSTWDFQTWNERRDIFLEVVILVVVVIVVGVIIVIVIVVLFCITFL